jgi:chromosome segregation protein
VQLLREFGSASQFIVITHNKKTMVGTGSLLGVSMEESGVTKVISVRLEHDEAARTETDQPQQGLFEEEEVEIETGRELPPGVDDPSTVSEAELRPIRGKATRQTPEAPAEESPPQIPEDGGSVL